MSWNKTNVLKLVLFEWRIRFMRGVNT